MNDKQSAAILLGLIAVAFIIWYRSRSSAQRSALFGTGPALPESSGDRKVAGRPFPVLPSVGGVDWSGGTLSRLMQFASEWGLTVTSSLGGKHVPGSAHYEGRAIDVRTRGVAEETIQSVIDAAKRAGFRVIDERQKMPWAEWSGPHLHIEAPR